MTSKKNSECSFRNGVEFNSSKTQCSGLSTKWKMASQLITMADAKLKEEGNFNFGDENYLEAWLE